MKRFAKPKKAVQPKAPQTVDDIVESAVEYEEQGERYQTGLKSLGFYKKAMQAYKQAEAMESSSDILYNIGRLFYILALFTSPKPSNTEMHECLLEAEKYLQGAIETCGELATFDAPFNQAQVLNTLANFYDEFTDLKPRYTIQLLFQRSNSLFESVYLMQNAQLKQLKVSNDLAIEVCEQQPDGEIIQDSVYLSATPPITNDELLDTLFEHTSLICDAMQWITDIRHLSELQDRAKLLLQMCAGHITALSSPYYIDYQVKITEVHVAAAEVLFDHAKLINDTIATSELHELIQTLHSDAMQILSLLLVDANEQILCELGDLYCFIAEFNLHYSNSPIAAFNNAADVYRQASRINAFNKTLLVTIGDVHMRILMLTKDLDQATRAVEVYERGFTGILSSAEVPDLDSLVQMSRLAKAYSWCGWTDKSVNLMRLIEQKAMLHYQAIDLTDTVLFGFDLP